jgi:hypothetical protein
LIKQFLQFLVYSNDIVQLHANEAAGRRGNELNDIFYNRFRLDAPVCFPAPAVFLIYTLADKADNLRKIAGDFFSKDFSAFSIFFFRNFSGSAGRPGYNIRKPVSVFK